MIHQSSWQFPPVFSWLQDSGNIDEQEMLRTFNCGIGMILVVSEPEVQDTLEALQDQGIPGWELGHISETATGVQLR